MNLGVDMIVALNQQVNKELDDVEFCLPLEPEPSKCYKVPNGYVAIVQETPTFSSITIKNKHGEVVSIEALPF